MSAPKKFPGALADRETASGRSTVSAAPGKPAKRKAIPVRVQVSVAIRQAREGAQAGCEYFPCGICRKPLHEDEPRILEHMVPRATRIALGLDPDAPEILALVHEPCAAKKTNGTKATTAGSDKHMIAKGNRLEVARLAKKDVEKKLTKERWRLKKKVDGTVVRVRTR
jgi:hypothetical protein